VTKTVINVVILEIRFKGKVANAMQWDDRHHELALQLKVPVEE
jgi:hypothetical protein